MAYADLATPTTGPFRTASIRVDWLVLAGLLAVAVALRGPCLGDPALGIDEEFYLLVGDRMWHGALPYVDIFDRKPLGLFLLYAAFRPFSSDGVIAYQVAALLFAAATAYVIARLASRLVSPLAAALAGCIYLLYLPIVGGAGGQSPVFYNLFMAIGALLILEADEGDDRRRSFALRTGAMLLVGVALQIKTSTVIEGVFVGCWAMYRSWARDRWPLGLAISAAVWVLAALVPTALAAGFYLMKGHGEAFLYANVQSALSKQEPAGFSELTFLRTSAIAMAPILLVASLAAVRLVWHRRIRASTWFVLVWSVFAIVGFFAIGHFYNHYALPVLLPLSILSATLAGRPVGIGLVAGLFLLWNSSFTGFPQFETTATHKARITALVTAMAPYTKYGCIYLNAGPPIVYLKTHSCLPTPLVFPEHLSIAAETKLARGQAAMAALIAGRPSAVLVPDTDFTDRDKRPLNTGNQALLAAALAKDYRLEALLRDPVKPGHLQLFVRTDLPDAKSASGGR